jgi:hypothetical protein
MIIFEGGSPMKFLRFFTVILTLLAAVAGIGIAADKEKDRGKDFVKTTQVPSIRGKVKDVKAGAGIMIVSVFEKGKITSETKSVRVGELTKLFYKKGAGQLDAPSLKAKISDFKPGDTVIVTAKSVTGSSIEASEIWEIRAFLAYTGMISTEKEYKGNVEAIGKNDRTLTVNDLVEKKRVDLVLDKTAKVYVNGIEGSFGDIKKDTNVYVKARWRGYEEDKPALIPAVEIKDAKTYVIHTMRDEFGPVIAYGKALSIDMASKTIKVGEEKGSAKNISFDGTTKWVFGTVKVKSPADLQGANIYVFGSPAREKQEKATQVINETALPALFDYLAKSGGKVGGQRAVLAFGELVGLNSSNITVIVAGGKKITCKVHESAMFIKGGKKVKRTDIGAGEWVKVEGFRTQKADDSIAVIVVSFGRTPENLKKDLK